MIDASQSGAMPLLFDVQPVFAVKEADEFPSGKEFFLRRGLPNFFHKLSQNKPVLHIAFLGGSITRAEDQYRNQTLAYIQTLSPNATIKGINAGVSGTGTELGACRVREQVIKYNPDLVFVEFAVNGGSNQAMEGIVRQIIKHNPGTEICFIYTIAGDQHKQYAKGEVPAKIQGFEKVAQHYQIPSIHLGLYPSLLEARGKLVWKSTTDVPGKIVFSKDGTHPARAGGDLYTQAIVRAFREFKNKSAVSSHQLPDALYADNWEDAGMLNPQDAVVFSKGWEAVNPLNNSSLNIFAPWFPTISKTETANASCTFKFEGTVFGFFDIGGPEVGQVLVEIDGHCVELKRKAGNVPKNNTIDSGFVCLVNRFNTHCNNRYRGQFEMFEVPYGVHEVKIILSPLQADKATILAGQNLTDMQQNPERYGRQVFYLGRILLKGKLIAK